MAAQANEPLRGFIIPTKQLIGTNVLPTVSDYTERNPRGPGPTLDRDSEGGVISVFGPMGESVTLRARAGGSGGQGAEPAVSVTDADGNVFGWWDQSQIRATMTVPGVEILEDSAPALVAVTPYRAILGVVDTSGDVQVHSLTFSGSDGLTVSTAVSVGLSVTTTEQYGQFVALCKGRDGNVYGAVLSADDFDGTSRGVISTFMIKNPLSDNDMECEIIRKSAVTVGWESSTYRGLFLYQYVDKTFHLAWHCVDGTTSYSALLRSSQSLENLVWSGGASGDVGDPFCFLPKKNSCIIGWGYAANPQEVEYISAWDAGTYVGTRLIQISDAAMGFGWEAHNGICTWFNAHNASTAIWGSVSYDFGSITEGIDQNGVMNPIGGGYGGTSFRTPPGYAYCGGGGCVVFESGEELALWRYGGFDVVSPIHTSTDDIQNEVPRPTFAWGGGPDSERGGGIGQGVFVSGSASFSGQAWTIVTPAASVVTSGCVTRYEVDYGSPSEDFIDGPDIEQQRGAVWIRAIFGLIGTGTKITFSCVIPNDVGIGVASSFEFDGTSIDCSLQGVTYSFAYSSGDLIKVDILADRDNIELFIGEYPDGVSERVAGGAYTPAALGDVSVDVRCKIENTTSPSGNGFCDLAMLAYCFVNTGENDITATSSWPAYAASSASNAIASESVPGAPLVSDVGVMLPVVAVNHYTTDSVIDYAGAPSALLVRAPLNPGMRWLVSPTSDTPAEAILPDVEPSPSRGFRSNDNDNVTLSFALPDACKFGPAIGLFIDGCNRPTVTVSLSGTMGTSTDIIEIDMLDPDGVGEVSATVYGTTVTFAPGRYLMRNELAGSHMRFETGALTYRYVRILSNTEGGSVGKLCTVTLDKEGDDDPDGLPADGTYDAWVCWKHAYVVLGGMVQAALDGFNFLDDKAYVTLTLDEISPSTETYAKRGVTCSTFCFGEALLVSPNHDTDWVEERMPDRETSGRDGRTTRRKVSEGPRRLSIGWTSAGGYYGNIRNNAPDHVTLNSVAVSNFHDVGYTLSGMMDDLDEGVRPVCVVRQEVVHDTPVFDRSLFLFGHLDSSVSLENSIGDEGEDEQLRVQTMAFMESK